MYIYIYVSVPARSFSGGRAPPPPSSSGDSAAADCLIFLLSYSGDACGVASHNPLLMLHLIFRRFCGGGRLV